MTRGRGTRLIETFSTKLGRRVVLHDYLAFWQWVRLETDPEVLSFCERPARSGPPQNCVIDFWVRRADGPSLSVIESRSDVPLRSLDDEPIEVVPMADLAAARMWITNWTRMLTVIASTRTLWPDRLMQDLLKSVPTPKPLSVVEREVTCGDPAIARGALFELLRRGRLLAPSLHTTLLSHQTLLEPRP